MRRVIRHVATASMVVALTVVALPASAETAAVVEPVVVEPAAGVDRFGSGVDLDGDTLAVRGCVAGLRQCRGSVDVFVRSAGEWVPQAHIVPAESKVGLDFGRTIAISGDTLVIGSEGPKASVPTASGSAYVFVREGDEWRQQARLTLPALEPYDRFAEDLAVDGDTVVVGASGRHFGDDEPRGAAYVFTRSGASWTLQAELIPPVHRQSDLVGTAVAVAADTVLVGAPGADTARTDAGKVEVFTRSGTTWSHRETLTDPDAGNNDGLGAAVALDGSTAAVGTDRYFEGRPERAFVFVGAGATWSMQARFVCSCDDADFGSRVDVSGDTVVLGAPRDTIEQNFQGAAYVYHRNGSAWTRLGKLTGPDPASSDNFGVSVAVDADTLAVGSGMSGAGQAFVYER